MWSQEPSGRVRTPLEPVVLAAMFAVVPTLIIEWDASGVDLRDRVQRDHDRRQAQEGCARCRLPVDLA
jgi:hypothetical protein